MLQWLVIAHMLIVVLRHVVFRQLSATIVFESRWRHSGSCTSIADAGIFSRTQRPQIKRDSVENSINIQAHNFGSPDLSFGFVPMLISVLGSLKEIEPTVMVSAAGIIGIG